MRHLASIAIATLALVGCGSPGPVESPGPASESEAATASEAPAGGEPEAPNETPEAESSGSGNSFDLKDSDSAEGAHGASESKIKPTKTEAALKFIVVDKEKGPIEGVVVALTAPDGKRYYTEETDSKGYAEVLVPVGKKYDLVYLSLGRTDIAASVPVADEPNQNIKLTLRYKRFTAEKDGSPPRFVLDGVNFDTGKATIRPESFPRLDNVVDFMQHKKSAKIEISGHTDNVGNKQANKTLSEKRANACRDYLISKGIDGSRIKAQGFGDERPIAPNDTEAGRQKNRRIEATEL